MIFKQSLKAVLRTPLKTFLFLILIVSVTAFACVGIGMWDSGSRLLRLAEDSFTTTASIEYGEVGDYIGESYTETMTYELSGFDYSRLSSSPAVKNFDRQFELGGYIDGFEMPRGVIRYSDSAVFRFVVSTIADVEYYNPETLEYEGSHLQIYAHLLESYYGGDTDPKEDTLIFINIDGRMIYDDSQEVWWRPHSEPSPERLEARIREAFQRGREFIAYGTAARLGDTSEEPITFTIQSLDTNLIDVQDTDRYFYTLPLWDITDIEDYESHHKFEILSNVAKSLTVRRHALAVHPTRNVESLPLFYLGETEILEGGRFFTEEEYRKGARSIIISEYVAKRLELGVGDTLNMSTFLADEESQVAALSFKSNDDFVDNGDYEIVGIYRMIEGENHRVYIPYPVNAPYEIKTGISQHVATATLKNGTAEQYMEDISPHLLPDMRVTIFDQGYSEVISPIVAMNRTALLLSVLGVGCCIAALILFTHLYVSRQRDTIVIMESLGAGKAKTLLYVILSLVIIVLLATAAGVYSGSVISQRVADDAYARSAQKALDDASFTSVIVDSADKVDFNVNFKTSLSTILYIGGGVILFTIILGIAFTAGVFRRPSVVLTHAGTTFRRRTRFTWKLVLRSIVRNGAKSVLLPAVSLVLAAFIAFFAADIEKSRAQIKELNENATISAYLTTMNGRRADLLKIEDYQVRPLLNSKYIKDVNYSTSGAWGSVYIKVPTTLTIDENNAADYEPYGLKPGDVLETFCLEDISYAKANFNAHIPIKEGSELEFLPGYKESVFRTNQKVCAISKEILEQKNLKLGDELLLNMVFGEEPYSLRLFFTATLVAAYEPSDDSKLCLPIGLLSPSGSDSAPLAAEQLEAYDQIWSHLAWGYPYPTPSEPLPENLYIPDNFPFIYKSFSFTLKNASELDEFKAFAKKVGYGSISRNDKSYGDMRLALVIDDARLTTSVNNIQRHIDYMNILNIVLYALSAIISFVLAYLMTKSRRKDLAMMRSMGSGYLKTFNTLFLEQALLFLFGCAISVGLVTLINHGFTLYQLMYLGGYALCCLTGIIISIVFMNRVDVLKLLSSKE